MTVEWKDLIPILREVEGTALLVNSSFAECPGSFTAVLADIDEKRKRLHLRKTNAPGQTVDEIVSLVGCTFDLIIPNQVLKRAFRLTAVRRPGEQILLAQEAAALPAEVRNGVRVGRPYPG